MMIIAEKMYRKTGFSSTKFFLKTFVDGSTVDLQFSKIAKEIHEWRNTVAHQLFSKQGHDLYFDWDLAEGWKKENGILYFNPGKYVDQFLTIFNASSSLWTHWAQQPEKVQKQKKYQFIAEYLELNAKDAIKAEIGKLKPSLSSQDFTQQERKIQNLIKSRYNL